MLTETKFKTLINKEIKNLKKRKKILEESKNNLITIILTKNNTYYKLNYYQNKKILFEKLIDVNDNEKNQKYNLHLSYRLYLLIDNYLNWDEFAQKFQKNKSEIPEKIERKSISEKKYNMIISDSKITCIIYDENNKKEYEGYLFHGGITAFNQLLERDTWL